MNLYRVTLKGMKHSVGNNVTYGISYVVAENLSDAYSMVKKYLDKVNLGFWGDRGLEKIELLASENTIVNRCNIKLYLDKRLDNA